MYSTNNDECYEQELSIPIADIFRIDIQLLREEIYKKD